MLKSDADLEKRVIDSMTDDNRQNADSHGPLTAKAGIKCVVGLDVMAFLRNKKDEMHLKQTIDFRMNQDGIIEGFVSNKLVLFSNASFINLPCDFIEEKGLVRFYFTDKAITYHTLLCMCEVIGISYGEVVLS